MSKNPENPETPKTPRAPSKGFGYLFQKLIIAAILLYLVSIGASYLIAHFLGFPFFIHYGAVMFGVLLGGAFLAGAFGIEIK